MKPRNAEEQAFWDAVYLAAIGALCSEMVIKEPSADWCARRANEALAERRKVTDADASP